jgi:ADP-ribose pyrophosphatase YjhB (NUDIX family)
MENNFYQKYLIVLAVAAFIMYKNKLLIVKKSLNEKVDSGLWTVPGGKIYPKESIINGLKREVKEEVGINIESIRWIGEDIFENSDATFHAQHFLCKTNEYDIKLEKSLIDFRWIDNNDVNIFKFPENIKRRIVEIFSSKNEY